MRLITINLFQRPSSIHQFCLSSPTTNYYYSFESRNQVNYIFYYIIFFYCLIIVIMTIIVWHCFIFCIQLFATIFCCITFYCIIFNTSNTLVTVLLVTFNPYIAQSSRLLPHRHVTAVQRDRRRIKKSLNFNFVSIQAVASSRAAPLSAASTVPPSSRWQVGRV